MSVKAVFYVTEVGTRANGIGVVKANAAAKGPYADYSKYTPTGTLEFTCLNEAATKFFLAHVGRDVVLEIRPATEEDILQPDPARS